MSTDSPVNKAPAEASHVHADERYGGVIYRAVALTVIAVFIGTVVSLAALAFVETIDWLNRLLLISPMARVQTESRTFLAIATVLAPALGGLLVGILIRHGSSLRKPTGPPDVIRAVQLHGPLPSLKAGVTSTFAVILSIGCGASVGQYGPLVYLGAMLGNLFTTLKLRIPNLEALVIAAGVAAAISTAFNAPIAGMVFAHELILRHYSLQAFAPTTVASVVGYIVANIVFEREPLFLVDFAGVVHGYEFLLFVLLGIAAAIWAVFFMRMLLKGIALASRWPFWPPLRTALAGALVGCTALMLPDVLGVGREALRFATIEGAFLPVELPMLVIAKTVLAALCIAAGFAGGVFSPALLIGILFGAFFWQCTTWLGIPNSGVVPYAISGMVAMASPVMGAPLTMIIMIFELTRNYDLTIAAMVAVVFSNLLAYRWFGRSLFDVQLAQQGVNLGDGRDRAILENRSLDTLLSREMLLLEGGLSGSEALSRLHDAERAEAIVIDAESRYLGVVRMAALQKADPHETIDKALESGWPVFDNHTTLWAAMQELGDFVGDAVALIDRDSREVLGVVTEGAIIKAYLDAVHGLRREEHHAL